VQYLRAPNAQDTRRPFATKGASFQVC
jgi:hypothetical protein